MTKRTAYAAALVALSLIAPGPGASAQEYEVAVAEENFRARPNGAKLGTLRKGTQLAGLREDGRWVKASLRAWIWKRSVGTRRGSSELVSLKSENLRATPSAKGRLLGTVLRGTAMKRLSQRGGWLQVSYDGWIWQPSLASAEAKASTRPAGAGRTIAVLEESLRTGPDGTRLGRLRRGADLAVLDARGDWLEVATRGYFFAASASGSGSKRKVAKPTENLRVAPGSEIVGVLARGTTLRVVGTAGRWLEVEVRGWIREPSTLALAGGETSAGSEAGGKSAARASADEAAGDEAPSGSPDVPAKGGGRGTAGAGLSPSTLKHSVPIKDGPDGALVGQALTGSTVVPLRTDGDWVKVQLEGWVPREALAGDGRDAPRVTIPAVMSDPARYRGASATWRLELIAVAQADGSRTDFEPGEHYLLTRNAGGEREYVYVVVPASLAQSFRELEPFTPLTIHGVVRTGRSALVGNPILEYRDLVRESR